MVVATSQEVSALPHRSCLLFLDRVQVALFGLLKADYIPDGVEVLEEVIRKYSGGIPPREGSG